MKPGDKVFVECVINCKIETSLGTYYVAHIDQYRVDMLNGSMDSSIKINLIEGMNKMEKK